MKSEKQLQEDREESLGYDNRESLNPERDELWAKHDGLTPTCCAEMIALAGKLEQERNVWKHEAEVVRKQLESEHEAAIQWFIGYQELKAALQDILDVPRKAADAVDEAEQMEAIAHRAYAKAKQAETILDSENDQREGPPDSGAPQRQKGN